MSRLTALQRAILNFRLGRMAHPHSEVLAVTVRTDTTPGCHVVFPCVMCGLPVALCRCGGPERFGIDF